MDFTISLYIIFASSIVGASCSVCTIDSMNNDGCTYTVLCRGHAGSASNPSCDQPKSLSSSATPQPTPSPLASLDPPTSTPGSEKFKPSTTSGLTLSLSHSSTTPSA
ncbi:hypothetical protein MSG28_008456 [Choristoneura fumiferana]|uniref:Uncharacterized protein n=1 Tax=Choristoneura fumiferana TaxID=7141 RepID=A0ACC0J6Y0_CHOFU|nr:hypothetical protein MSG28_008456 [Choristoneura fumiferana]